VEKAKEEQKEEIKKAGNPLWNVDRYRMHEDRFQMDVVFKF